MYHYYKMKDDSLPPLAAGNKYTALEMASQLLHRPVKWDEMKRVKCDSYGYLCALVNTP